MTHESRGSLLYHQHPHHSQSQPITSHPAPQSLTDRWNPAARRSRPRQTAMRLRRVKVKRESETEADLGSGLICCDMTICMEVGVGAGSRVAALTSRLA